MLLIYIYIFEREKGVGYMVKGWREERKGGNDITIF